MADEGLEEIGVKFVSENEEAFKRSIKGAGDAVDNLGLHFDEAANRWRTSSGQFATNAEMVSAGVKRMADDGKSNINGWQAALTGAFTAVASVAVEAMARAGEAVAGFVTGSIDQAMDFEKGLSVLKATAGATPEELQKVRDLSMQLGNDLQLPASSAMDANEAILELVKGGLSLEDAMAAARGTLLLSTAAEIDAAEAANIAAGALNAFGLEGKDAQHIVDLLAGAAAKGAGEITDYAAGFQQGGFAFKSAGQDADSLAAALQTLIERGLTGSDAGTALKNAIIRLQAPTKEASALMEGLGINVFDAQGNMKPFNEIIGILNTQMAGMTQEQRNAALNTIFLSDGMKAMIPLLDDGQKKFEERKAAVAEAGSAQALAAAQTEGYAGAIAALENSMSTLQLMIGTTLLPILTDLINNVVIPGVQAVMSFASAFLSAGGPMETIGGIATNIFNVFRSVFNLFTGSGDSGTVIDFVAILGESLGLSGDALYGFMDAADMVLLTLGHFASIVQEVFGLWQQIAGAVIPLITSFFEEHGAEIQAFMQNAFAQVVEIVNLALEAYRNYVVPTLTGILNFIQTNGDSIKNVFKTVWDIIKFLITTVLAVIRTAIQVSMALMKGDTEGALNAVKGLFETIWQAIVDLVGNLVNQLATAISQKMEEIKTGIATTLQNILTSAQNLVQSFFNLGRDLIQGLLNGLNSMVQAVFNFFSGLITSAVQSAIAGLPPGIREAVTAALGLSNVSQSATQASAAAAGFQNVANTSYNLTLNTGKDSSGVVSDFTIMQSLAR